MPDSHRRRIEQDLWKLPAFALIAPPIVLVLALLISLLRAPLYSMRLLEAYFLLGCLSPVLGLLTLAILAVQYSMFWEELHFGRIGPRRVALLAVLAVIAPTWLTVMYLFAIGFSR